MSWTIRRILSAHTVWLLGLLIWAILGACAPVETPAQPESPAPITPPSAPATALAPAQYPPLPTPPAHTEQARQWAVVHNRILYTVHRGHTQSPHILQIEDCRDTACSIGPITWTPGGSYLLYMLRPAPASPDQPQENASLRAADSSGTVHILRTLPASLSDDRSQPEAAAGQFVPYIPVLDARDATLTDPAELVAYFDQWLATIEDEGQFGTAAPPAELLQDLGISDWECRNPGQPAAEVWPCLPDAPDNRPAPVPTHARHLHP